MSNNKKYSVEDFWPEAEKLLDDHFKSIPFWKRYIKQIIVAFSIALVATTLILYNFSTNQNSSSNKTVLNQNTSIINQDLSKDGNINQENNKPQIESENNALNTFSNKSATVSNGITKSNNSPEINQNSLDNNEKVSLENSIKNNDQSAENSISTKSSKLNTDSEDAEKQMSNNQVVSSNINSALNESLANNDGLSGANRLESNVNLLTATNPESNSNYLSKNIPIKSEIQSKNNKTLDDAVLNGMTNVNTSDSQNKISLDEGNAIANGSAINSFNTSIKLEALQGLKLSDYLKTNEFSKTQFKIENDDLLVPKNKRKNITMRYEINSSAFYLSKKLSSSTLAEYVNRRKDEEQNIVTISYGFGAEVQFNRFGVFTGAEVMNYGEKVAYQNWLYGDVVQIEESQNLITDTILVSTYNYIQGNEFEVIETSYISDTVNTYDTTLTKGQVANEVSSINANTRLSYVEIPLGFTYSFPLNGRLIMGVRAGISVGFLRELKGYYIDPQLSEFVELNKTSYINSTLFNSRLAIDLNYYLRPGFSVFARPEWRSNINSVIQNQSDISQRYNAVGLTFGLSKSF